MNIPHLQGVDFRVFDINLNFDSLPVPEIKGLDRRMDGQTGRRAHGQTDRLTDVQTDRRTDEQMGRRVHGQKNGQTEREIYQAKCNSIIMYDTSISVHFASKLVIVFQPPNDAELLFLNALSFGIFIDIKLSHRIDSFWVKKKQHTSPRFNHK